MISIKWGVEDIHFHLYIKYTNKYTNVYLYTFIRLLSKSCKIGCQIFMEHFHTLLSAFEVLTKLFLIQHYEGGAIGSLL